MQTQYYCYRCSINTTDFPIVNVYVTDFSVVKVHVDELSSARIWQHKLCATLSAKVNINCRLLTKVYIQYWSVDGKYRIYLTRLRNGGERRAFSESFSPFRAESNKFYIYRQQINIVFILQSTMS